MDKQATFSLYPIRSWQNQTGLLIRGPVPVPARELADGHARLAMTIFPNDFSPQSNFCDPKS